MKNKLERTIGSDRLALATVSTAVIFYIKGPACPSYLLFVKTIMCATLCRLDVNHAGQVCNIMILPYFLLLKFLICIFSTYFGMVYFLCSWLCLKHFNVPCLRCFNE